MTTLKTIFSILFCFLMTLELSAQCGSGASPNPSNDGNGGYIGNSFIANCSGPNFVQLNLYRSGRDVSGFGQTNDVSEHQGTITIYQGESVDPANEIYSQSATFPAIPNDDGHHLMEIPLTGGTGSTAFTQGQMYTFRFSVPSNAYRWSVTDSPYADGRIHYGGQWWDHADLVFEMIGGTPGGSSGGGSSSCDLVSNGDFEDGLNGWTPELNNGAEFVSNLGNPGQAVGLNFSGGFPDPGIAQTITVTAGVPHTVSGEYRGGPNNVHLHCSPGQDALGVFVDGAQVEAFQIPQPTMTDWTSFSTTFTPTTSGTVTLSLRGEVNGSDCDVLIDNIEVCGGAAAVPTMGEWALIILALIIMSMGVITVMKWQSVQNLQTAGGNAQVSMNTGNSLPFNKKSYFQILPFVWGGLVAVFAVSMAFFGYEMTSADIPGALMAGGVGAYLIHLIRK